MLHFSRAQELSKQADPDSDRTGAQYSTYPHQHQVSAASRGSAHLLRFVTVCDVTIPWCAPVRFHKEEPSQGRA